MRTPYQRSWFTIHLSCLRNNFYHLYEKKSNILLYRRDLNHFFILHKRMPTHNPDNEKLAVTASNKSPEQGPSYSSSSKPAANNTIV